MAIRFQCPLGHRLIVPDERAGKKGKCPVCRQRVMIPHPEPAAAEARPKFSDPNVISIRFPAPPPVERLEPGERVVEDFDPDVDLPPAAGLLPPPGSLGPPLPTETLTDPGLDLTRPPEPKLLRLPTELPPEPPVAPTPSIFEPIPPPLAAATEPPVSIPFSEAIFPPPPPAGPGASPPVSPTFDVSFPPPLPPVAAPAGSQSASPPYPPSGSVEAMSPPPRGAAALPPPDIYEPEPHRVQTVYMLAVGMVVVTLFSMSPAIKHLNLVDAPGWARIVLLISALQLLYIAWMVSLPDWSTVWIGMVVFALVSAMYAAGIGVAVVTPLDHPMVLEMNEVRRTAAGWCLAVLLLTTLMTYLCGRYAFQWRKAYELAKARRSESVGSRSGVN